MKLISQCRFWSFCFGLAILFCASNLTAQFNIKVGYMGGYTSFKTTESIFNRFNEGNPNAEKPLSNINVLHGIELGGRYKFKNWGIDGGLSSVSGKSTANGVIQPNGSTGNDDWQISVTTYYVGLENYIGSFGYGANIGFQRLKYKTDISGQKKKRTVYEESVPNSKFYFILEVPSKSISFSIRPYVSFNWKPYNIQGVELEFEPSSVRPISEFDQDVTLYGVSFLFYNGPQRRK